MTHPHDVLCAAIQFSIQIQGGLQAAVALHEFGIAVKVCDCTLKAFVSIV